MKKFAVMGNPIAHSKSPEIHYAFAKQFNIHLSYERLQVASGELQQQLQCFAQEGGYGVNITVPFKEQAWQLVQQRTPRADQAQAVNTITFAANGLWQGDNTDGVGLIRDLRDNLAFSIQNKNVALLGAGGAAKGILAVLLAEKPASLVIAHRTAAKAQLLKQQFLPLCAKLTSCSFAELTNNFDLIIQATSAGVKGETLDLPATCVKGAFCYDLSYGNSAKSFLSWAGQHGAIASSDGLGMLVEQAAEAFYIWHRKKPETQSVIVTLREG